MARLARGSSLGTCDVTADGRIVDGALEPVDVVGSVALHGDRNIDAVVVILMLTSETGLPRYDFIVELARRYPTKPARPASCGGGGLRGACGPGLRPRGPGRPARSRQLDQTGG
jgi:hypothetical protein